MARSEFYSLLSKAEAEELVAGVLTSTSEEPKFVQGVVRLASLPWFLGKVNKSTYEIAESLAKAKAAKLGVVEGKLERANQLVNRIYEYWSDLYQRKPGTTVTPDQIRAILISEGTIQEWTPPALPTELPPWTSYSQGREPLGGNPFEVKGGRKPYA